MLGGKSEAREMLGMAILATVCEEIFMGFFFCMAKNKKKLVNKKT